MATAEFSKFAGILSAALSQLQGTSTKDTGFPRSSVGKESACNSGDPSSIPGLGRSVGEGNGNPLKYSCLENPMDRGAWQATVHEVTRKDIMYASWKSHKEKRGRIVESLFKEIMIGTSLVVQWLRTLSSPRKGPGSIAGQGTRSCMLKLKSLHAVTKDPTNRNWDLAQPKEKVLQIFLKR